jgi:hypothetical protein
MQVADWGFSNIQVDGRGTGVGAETYDEAIDDLLA